MTHVKYSINSKDFITESFNTYDEALTVALDYLQSGYLVQIIEEGL